jgi:hypothetical protein
MHWQPQFFECHDLMVNDHYTGFLLSVYMTLNYMMYDGRVPCQ